MPEAGLPLDEIARLSALHSLKLLDTPPEERFDRLSRLATQFLKLPVAYVALMDGERQWYKSSCGLPVSEVSRKHSLCSHTILCDEPIICPNTLQEPRFADNPFVSADPNIRLYMGHNLETTSGHRVGTFCAMGFEAREISAEEVSAFKELAKIAESEINHIDLVLLQEDLLEKKRDLQKYTDFVRDVFGRYVSDQVAENLLSHPSGLDLGGAHREISILFSDLRGFSTLSERLPAQQMIELVNEYLGAMVPVIERHGGTIDEFIGDAILVLFGAPLAQEDHALRAVACALEMQQELSRLNVRLQTDNRTPIQMGIGVHTGKAVVGNIGCQSRMKYGAVGSAVNLASRIQGFTLGGQTLVSSSTYQAIKPYARVDGQLRVAVKGYDGPVSVFDIGALQGGGIDVELPVPVHTTPVHC
jgi:adenylate cyclase